MLGHVPLEPGAIKMPKIRTPYRAIPPRAGSARRIVAGSGASAIDMLLDGAQQHRITMGLVRCHPEAVP